MSALVALLLLLASPAAAQPDVPDEADDAGDASETADGDEDGEAEPPSDAELAEVFVPGQILREWELPEDATDDDGETLPPGERHIRYFLEAVEIAGNDTTLDYVVRRFVPLEEGEVLDVDDPAIETIRWRLLGTGYFDDVRLRLTRGSRRGWVVLVIEVEERNTLLIQQIALGFSRGISSTSDTGQDLLPYAGITVAETNLLGLGMELSASALASQRQQGVRLRFTDPVFLGSDFLFSSSLSFNNGREFFGDDPLVAVECPEPDPGEEPDCPPEVEARSAVVFYKRYGLSVGMGHDLGSTTRFTLDWQGDLVDVGVRPDAASESVGEEVEPIDFAIEEGLSLVSALRFGLVWDRRDDPGLTSEGVHVRFSADVASGLLGSDYSFLRMQAFGRLWVPLPWGHSVRFGAFAGAIFGSAPFFYQFHHTDLTDLIPGRILEMNIDGRPPPNVFDTAVAEQRAQDLAARVDVEYGLPLYRGESGFRALNAYFVVGLYALADQKNLRVAIAGYEGLARIPVDLTFDIGLRADTTVGVFQLGFSNVLGFIDLFDSSDETP